MRSALLLLALMSCFLNSNAQLCTPNAPIGTPSVSPPRDSIACAQIAVPYNQSMYIENLYHDSVSVQGTKLQITIDTLRIDSIVNVPCGLHYTTNPADGIILGGQTGCVTFYGTTNDTVGQYKLDVYVSIFIQVPILGYKSFSGKADSLLSALSRQLHIAAPVSFKYWIRVIDSTSACPQIDTTNTAHNRKPAKECYFPGQFVITISGDTTACPGDSVTLTTAVAGNPVGTPKLHWSTGDTTSIIKVAAPISVGVTATAGSYSYADSNYHVTLLNLPTDSFITTLFGNDANFVGYCRYATKFKYLIYQLDSNNNTTLYDSIITLTDNGNYTFSKAGKYLVTLLDTGACGNLAKSDTVVITTAGFGELNTINGHLSVSPNPSNGLFDVRVSSPISNDDIYIVRVVSVQGQTVYETTLKGNVTKHLALTDLAAGMYLVHISSNNYAAVQKMIIK